MVDFPPLELVKEFVSLVWLLSLEDLAYHVLDGVFFLFDYVLLGCNLGPEYLVFLN